MGTNILEVLAQMGRCLAWVESAYKREQTRLAALEAAAEAARGVFYYEWGEHQIDIEDSPIWVELRDALDALDKEE